jgi:hypothetical protein
MDGIAVSHVITLGEDITDRRRLEESVHTKLASIGKLAAGIAHDQQSFGGHCRLRRGAHLTRSDQNARRSCSLEDFPAYLKIIDDEIFHCKGAS